ncbi:hypothetical protein LMG26857_03364 [Achromobacter anxifer]|uniref:hypothetical protein n=1 Tax=Achromobacter anxifer TaxID=1287737 RepID=UPI00155BD9D8|nr:hypothetical protein [Achromobacter anxifer]CAB5514305.1 hypothetical protein LMG26857_03364 [Achromobacter anxifer]
MTLNDMKENCTNCSADLEIGQIGKCDSCQAEQTTHVKVIVLCRNSEGVPEFHSCDPEVTDAQRAAGEHYELAKENAGFNGYSEPMIAFDATDPAAKQLTELHNWL